MSKHQLIALGILGLAVITVYTLGIVMAADVLKTVQAGPAEQAAGSPLQQSPSSPYPATWTPTLTPTPGRPTLDSRLGRLPLAARPR